MAVVNKTSTIITNRDASPVVLTDPSVSGGRVRQAAGYVGATSGNSIGSTYRFCSVPSNARVSAVLLACEAIGTSCTIDIGVYQNTANGGAVISAAFFASAVDISAALNPVNVTNESGTNTIAKQEMPLWQALGLSVDPECDLDIVGTLVAAAAATGNIQIRADFIQ